MTQLSVLIHQLQQAETSADAGHLPVCMADWQGTYQVPKEVNSISVSFESYTDSEGNQQVGNIVKLS